MQVGATFLNGSLGDVYQGSRVVVLEDAEPGIQVFLSVYFQPNATLDKDTVHKAFLEVIEM